MIITTTKNTTKQTKEYINKTKQNKRIYSIETNNQASKQTNKQQENESMVWNMQLRFDIDPNCMLDAPPCQSRLQPKLCKAPSCPHLEAMLSITGHAPSVRPVGPQKMKEAIGRLGFFLRWNCPKFSRSHQDPQKHRINVKLVRTIPTWIGHNRTIRQHALWTLMPIWHWLWIRTGLNPRSAAVCVMSNCICAC